MAFKILKLRRGVESALPTLQEGEIGFCTDTKRLFIGTSSGNEILQNVELDKKASTSSLSAHTSSKANPHSVTKSQVGLGNVDNVSTNNQKPTYSAAASLTTLSSGETMTTAFGKIAKAISELIAHIANKANPHSVTKAQVGLDKVDNTADSSKTVAAAEKATNDGSGRNIVNTYVEKVSGKGLSANDYTTADKNKLAGIATGANKTIVDSSLSTVSTNPVQNKIIDAAIKTKVNTSDFNTHTGNTGIHVASVEKTNWNNAKTVADNVVKTWGTYTLSESNWSTESGTGYMKQTFAVTGMQAAHNPTMIPVFTSLALSADEKQGFGLLIDATTTAGYVTVRCSAAPTVAMKFKLVGV